MIVLSLGVAAICGAIALTALYCYADVNSNEPPTACGEVFLEPPREERFEPARVLSDEEALFESAKPYELSSFD